MELSSASSDPDTGRGARFRLRCWGARGTVAAPGSRTVRYGGNTSCVEVRSGRDELIVVDAGTGIRALGQALALEEQTQADASAINLFLTHRHSDHVIGLPHFAPLFSSTRQVRIIGGDCDEVVTRALLETLLCPPLFPPLPALSERISVLSFRHGSTATVGNHGCIMHRFDARHPGGAVVFRIDDAKGPAIAFAPDNELDYASSAPEVLAWRTALVTSLRNVPILLHDATYSDLELASHRGWGHSSALEATRFAMECVAGMLVLFHHHPDRSDDAVDAMLQECRQMVALSGSSLRVIAAWEGMTLTV